VAQTVKNLPAVQETRIYSLEEDAQCIMFTLLFDTLYLKYYDVQLTITNTSYVR